MKTTALMLTTRTLRSAVAGLGLALAALLQTGAEAAVTPSSSDLWDLSQGSAITATSGIRNGFSAADMFGTTASIVERGNTVFVDGKPEGFTHYVEWRTATPVIVNSFALFAAGDGAANHNAREFDRFVLKAKSPGSPTYDLVLYDYTATHPYSFVEAATQLLLSADITAAAAQEFRAEFVQYNGGSTFTGPRIVELDAFGTAVGEFPADVWDLSQGTVVTATSGVRSGFAAGDMFGGLDSSLDPGCTVFADGKPAGFTHYIEWRTAAPVTLDSFALFASGDGPANLNAREFDRFVLKAKSPGSSTFDLVLCDFTPTHPYSYVNSVTQLLLKNTIPAVTAQDFRAEFVQFSGGSGYDGPRIIELDAFCNQSPVANAGADQSVAVGNNCQAAVTLDGTASSDPDNDALTFAWTGDFGTASGATPTITLGAGVHTLTLTVDDGRGGTASDTVVITAADITAPTLLAPAGTTASADASGQALVPNVLPGAGAVDNCTPTANLNLWQSPLPGTPVGLGTHTLTLKASDSAGNQATATTTFTVVDTTPPSVAAPAGITSSADANGQAPIPDVLASVVATDNCTPADQLIKQQNPSAGALVGMGTHTITVGVADAAGNIATATTTFTVVDTTAPVFHSLTANPSLLSPANGQLRSVTLTASVTDNTDPAPGKRIISVTANEPIKAPGPGVKNPDYEITGDLTLKLRAKSSTKAGRIYTLTVQSTDASGNASTATVQVQVKK